MNNSPSSPSPLELLHEVDARMSQALDNFFQRSREPILEVMLRALEEQMSPSKLAAGQACLDWLRAYPDQLSSAFAHQFRLHLIRPETFAVQASTGRELQLVDEETFHRQLTEEKISARITDTLRADVLLLAGRMHDVRAAALEPPEAAEAYSPLAVVRALSRGLDTLGLSSTCGTELLQAAEASLLDTLRHTYAGLNRFLATHEAPETRRVTRTRPSAPDPGQDILDRLRSDTAPARGTSAGPSFGWDESAGRGFSAPLVDMLAGWNTRPVPAYAGDRDTVLVLRELQQQAREQPLPAFDLAVLDAVAALFEFILDDPAVSPRYKANIALLQIPALRVALTDPDFFADEQHPTRQLIDMMGTFSRRFPEHSPSHALALDQIEQSAASILAHPDASRDAFAASYDQLAAWLAGADARAAAQMASEVEQLEHIERQELGTLLALENLHDLVTRYPAPESVVRRLEAAWVPHMASLYVTEAGEGPAWRDACLTLLQLFQSLQAPGDEAMREARLQTIPGVNDALRRGLVAQGAEAEQLKDFFGAITATQECWVRPGMVPSSVGHEAQQCWPADSISLGRAAASMAADDALVQAQGLLEGDWVDFDPPYDGLSTARVAWVGVHGYLLFCDSEGEQRFSLDCAGLAVELRAGRARIPEHSLTRKAMLRLRTQLSA